MTELDGQREGGIESDEDRQLEQHRQAAGKRVHMMPAVEFHDLLLERELVVLEALPKLGHLWLNLLHFSHIAICLPGKKLSRPIRLSSKHNNLHAIFPGQPVTRPK